MDLSAYTDEELMAIAGGGGSSRLPRGLRNNNPLNLEATVNWTGMQGNDGRFAVFPDLETGVAAADRNLQTYHQKHGLNTVEGVINRWAPPTENDSRAYATRVSQTLGVDPAAPLDMSDPGVRRALLDAMADVENGQSVDLGAPTMPADLSGFTDEELAQIAGVELAPRQVARTASGGVTIDVEPATPARAAPAAPRPTIAQDAVSGLLAPLKTLGRDVVDDYRRVTSRAGQPLPSIPEAIMQSVEDFGSKARIIGDVLGLAGAPVMAAVRPASRAVNRTGVPIYERPKLQDIGKGKVPQRITDPNQRQAVIEGTINTALSAAKPASPGVRPQAPKPLDLDELRTAKNAAYTAVDNAGVRFWPNETDNMIDGLRQTLAANGIDPVLNPKAARAMQLIEARKGRAMTLSEVDDLRKIIQREVLSSKEGGDQFFGTLMRDRIDDFLDNLQPNQMVPSNTPVDAGGLIRQAREANRRYRNVKEVADRTVSADLKAATTYAGGNQANAARQTLRPLIDPKSPQRLKGLKPAETKALKRVIEGTPAANAVRQVGKVLDPRGLMGAVVLGPLGIPTAGAAPAVGALSSAASNALTNKAIKDALSVLAMGGKATGASLPQIISGLVGVSEVAAPLVRIPSAPPKKKAATKARAAPRRK